MRAKQQERSQQQHVQSIATSATSEAHAKTHVIELVEHHDRRLPIHTRVGDRDAVLERSGALGRDVLPSRMDVRLDHDAGDVPVARGELRADALDDLWLVVVVLLRVAVCARARVSQPSLDKRGDGISAGSRGGGGHLREQSIMMDGWWLGRAFSMAAAAALTCSAE